MGIELATLLSSLRSEIDRARLDSATHVVKLKLGAVTSTGEQILTGDDVSELLTTTD